MLERRQLSTDRPVRRLRRDDPRLRRHRPLRAGLRGRDRPDAAATYAANFGPRHDDAARSRSRTSRRSRRPTSSSAARPARASRRSTATASASSGAASGASTCARSSRAAPRAFVMENVPELLRSAEYAAFKKRRRDELGYTRRGQDPERRRLRRPAAPPARDRRSASATARSPWPEPTHADPDSAPARPTALADVPRRRRGAAAEADGEAWHVGRNPRPTSIRRYKAVPRDGGNRFQMQRNLDARRARRPRPRLLAEQADRHDRRLRPALVGPARLHDPHRVLQAREGPLPAPERAPADHGPRGGALHELPGRLRASRTTSDDRDRQADRQRGAAAARAGDWPRPWRSRWTPASRRPRPKPPPEPTPVVSGTSGRRSSLAARWRLPAATALPGCR